MQVAVLAKVVPPLHQLRYDPDRRTIDREGISLYVNPFDQRALRVALDVRREGEDVSVVCMGPPSAEPLLRESLALGARRAILVSDPGLAGSDVLVTSRVLARAVARVGHDLVLVGDRTVDSGTGLVGPGVAALLGVPVFTRARVLLREESGDGFEFVGDTEDGRVRARFSPPVVVSVGEKIARLRKATVEQAQAAEARSVERWSLNDLGFAPGDGGLLGSRTMVTTVTNEEPTRVPQIFADGPVADRVRLAAEAVTAALHPAAPKLRPLATVDGPLSDAREVLVLASGPRGEVRHASLGILAEIRRVVVGYFPAAVVVGGTPSREVTAQLAAAGAVRGYVWSADPPVHSRTAALAFEEVFQHRPGAAAGVFPAESFGREVAGQLAAHLRLGLTGEAIGVRADSIHGLVWTKPSFGGGALAEVHSTTKPSLATIQPGAFPEPPGRETPEAMLAWEAVGRIPISVPFELLEETREVMDGLPDVRRARVVISIGMGLGGPERVAEVREVARQWGAAVGATRRVVDAGWVPPQLQIGLTGRSVAPALAVLLGTLGAANHLVGFRRARVLLAVNDRADAPVFQGVDVGIVGSWDEVLPLLAVELAPLVDRLNAQGE